MNDVGEWKERSNWLAREVLPFEPHVRSWLRRAGASQEDADDLIQEAYCKIMDALANVEIERPSAFFFQTTRNLFRNQIHRNGIVRIELGVDFDRLMTIDDSPSPEHVAGARQEFALVHSLIKKLPERCRQIFEMRKIDGLSQREIAEKLDVSEHIVENEGARGIRLVIEGLRDQGSRLADHYDNKRKKRMGRT